MSLALLTTIVYTQGAGSASFAQSLAVMALAALAAGFVVLAFVIICATVASALSFGLWLTLATCASAKRGLLPRAKLAMGRVILRT